MTRNAHIVVVASVILGVFAWQAGASAQPVAEKPVLEVGDRWQFNHVTEPSGKQGRWSRRIVEILPEGHARVRYRDDSLHLHDDAMNPFRQDRPDQPFTLVKYPLKVGDSWKFEVKHEDPNAYESWRAVVGGYEKITVPAGEFSCYRVESTATYVYRHYASTIRHSLRWFCPEVKWMAKEIIETRAWTIFNPAANSATTETSELVRFTAGNR